MARIVTRWFLALAYLTAGVLHLLVPQPFLAIMPGFVPLPGTVVFATGVAEILGALGLAQGFSPRLRRAAGIALALYALCVWPANMQHMINDLGGGDGLGLAYHLPRMIAQPVIIWATLWASGAMDWPFARAAQASSRSSRSSSPDPL